MFLCLPSCSAMYSSRTMTEAHSSMWSQDLAQGLAPDLVDKYLLTQWSVRAGFPRSRLSSHARKLALLHTALQPAEQTMSPEGHLAVPSTFYNAHVL